MPRIPLLKPLFFLGAIALAGCASIPDTENQLTLDDAQKKYVDSWNVTPAIDYRESKQSMEIVRPGTLPVELYEMPIEVALSRPIDSDDLAMILREAGIPTLFASDEAAQMSIHVPSYRGSIGSFLQALASANDLGYSWTGSVLVIEKASQYILRSPQQREVIDAMSSALTSLGAEDVSVSLEAGIIRYNASRRSQSAIEIYLDRMMHNTSVVNLQLAVINVKLDENKRDGFDWSSLSLLAGDLGIAEGLELPETTGELFQLTSNSLGASVVGGSLSLQGALNLLSTYGTSRTAQNLMLKTLSSVPVKIRSGNKLPYIDNVNVTTVGYSASSGMETKELKTGFEAEIAPIYDAEERSVTLNMTLVMETLIGFREMSGGDQLGTVELPETQDQEFNSTVRLEAGETALVGGLIYESATDARTSLRGLERFRAGSRNLTVSKNAMFILLRPTVTIYGKQAPEVSL